MKLKDLSYLYYEIKYAEKELKSYSLELRIADMKLLIEEEFFRELYNIGITKEQYNLLEDIFHPYSEYFTLFSIRIEDKSELFQSLLNNNIIVPLNEKQIKKIDDDYEYTKSCGIEYYKATSKYTIKLKQVLGD